MASFFMAIFLCHKKDIMNSGTNGLEKQNCFAPEKNIPIERQSI
jgi:hypothetical protein